MCVCIVLSSPGSASSPQTISATRSIQVCPAAAADWQFLFGSWPFSRRMSSSVTPKRWEAVKSTGRWVEFLRQTLVIRQSLPGNRLLYRFCETKRKRLIHRTLYEFHFSTNMKGGTEEEKGDRRRTQRAATVKWDFLRTGGIGSGRRPTTTAPFFAVFRALRVHCLPTYLKYLYRLYCYYCCF